MLASEILRMVLGLAAVIGMIGLAALAVRKAGLSSLACVAGQKRRLSVSEMLPLDARRRLALIRCDEREYLVILGPAGETLVASDLKAAEGAESIDAQSGANPFSSLSLFAAKMRGVHKLPEIKKAA
ncbi:MAG: flagellar biosynthetic protein FliO [Pseudomonadota bacterium]